MLAVVTIEPVKHGYVLCCHPNTGGRAGEDEHRVCWEVMARFAPQLDALQHKGEKITNETPVHLKMVAAE